MFRYSYTYNRGDNYTRVDTPVIIAKFTAQDTNITFQFPEFRNAAEAGENIGNIRWSLIDSDKKVIEKAEDTLRIDGMQIGRNYVRETEDYNEAGGPAAIKSKRHTVSLPPTSTTSSTVSTSIEATSSVATAAAIEAIPKQATSTSNTPNADTAEEMLHFWYDKASPETKARFKEYVNQ
ncbi:DUF2057 family protein [Vibrio sp. kj40-1]|uniref:DUF2057 family protein n=1 Tax=Vibrio algarum TaxID=3020714 RepID=A0ABT4YRG0_9VIBR|nr:DUF2057 family protein [Vibrio sp. KJ40-1]